VPVPPAAPLPRGRPRLLGWLLVATACLLFLGVPLRTARGEPTADDRTLCQKLLKDAIQRLVELEKSKDPAKAYAAIDLLDRAERLCPDDPEIAFNRALAWLLAGVEDKTRLEVTVLERKIAARAAMDGRPSAEAQNDPRLLYVQARIHYRFGNNPRLALTSLVRLHARNPQFMSGPVASLTFLCHLAYANQLIYAKDSEEAIRQVQLALTYAGDDAARADMARRNLAQIYRFAERWPESQAVWEDLVKRYPGDAIMRYGLASTLADQYKFEEACTQWKEVLRLAEVKGSVDPREADQLLDAPLRYAVSLVHAGHVDEGKARLLAEAKAHPDDRRVWHELGIAAMEQFDDPDHAVEWLEKARSLDPWCETTLRSLLILYTGPRRDEGRAKALQATLDSEVDKKARQVEMDRRRDRRPDRTNGCD